jgi:uncharacterized protein with PIN domain
MDENPSSLRFICDEQLGKLARWLRILGLDVIYSNYFPDDELIACAEKESRVILTRDTHLPEVGGQIRIYLVRENYPYHQIREVVNQFKDEIILEPFSRCADCNVPLYDIPKSEVKDRVPPFVFKTHEEFRTCPSCGRIFWEATHMRHIKKQLQDVLGELMPEEKG